MKIGVIAEEKNDIEVLYELTCKLVRPSSFSFKKFIGHGCGTLRRKCNSWARNLLQRGCQHIVVLHDLDCYIESELRRNLRGKIEDIGFCGHIILIPRREIEAWLLVDADALAFVFNMRDTPRIPARPEAIIDPKRKLKEIIKRSAKKSYVNTVHNKRIASAIDIEKLKIICPSFERYPMFVETYINQS